MSPTAKFTVRRRPEPGENIFLIGPGGVGKSTLGANLARLSGYPLVDLDLEFCQRIAIIGPFIVEHGYEAYRAANLALAQELVGGIERPSIFVTSSGFLVAPPHSSDYQAAVALIGTGYSIGLLPSLGIAEATDIVVGRQLGRGFGLERETEVTKFQKRFAIYSVLGDMHVVSAAPPDRITKAVTTALCWPAVQTQSRRSGTSNCQ
ncbi:shikimate kinase [Devosia sp. SL43]|uniref:shikimate kinase n=1 Tax=Devosia sp. SL43 TaxID=2806348 RepID=UPI001F47FA14|nr:shikimate kinase [Devosia sp. SL43]UJW86328.1 shikimate kinase [Devosia sp. SL43]